jgi:hypothetical protein
MFAACASGQSQGIQPTVTSPGPTGGRGGMRPGSTPRRKVRHPMSFEHLFVSGKPRVQTRSSRDCKWARLADVAYALCGTEDDPTDEDVIPTWMLNASRWSGVRPLSASPRKEATRARSGGWGSFRSPSMTVCAPDGVALREHTYGRLPI